MRPHPALPALSPQLTNTTPLPRDGHRLAGGVVGHKRPTHGARRLNVTLGLECADPPRKLLRRDVAGVLLGGMLIRLRVDRRDGGTRGDAHAEHCRELAHAMPDARAPAGLDPPSVGTVRVDCRADDLLLTGAGDLVVLVRCHGGSPPAGLGGSRWPVVGRPG